MHAAFEGRLLGPADVGHERAAGRVRAAARPPPTRSPRRRAGGRCRRRSAGDVPGMASSSARVYGCRGERVTCLGRPLLDHHARRTSPRPRRSSAARVQVVRDHEQPHPALALELQEGGSGSGPAPTRRAPGSARRRPRAPDRGRARGRCRSAAAARPRTGPGRRPGRWPPIPTDFEQLAGSARRARPARRRGMSSGSATTSPTVNRPSIDSYGSWKIIPIALRAARSARAERPYAVPLKRSAPSLGHSRPTISRAVVDLPHPRLAHDAERSAGVQLERHGVDGGHAPRTASYTRSSSTIGALHRGASQEVARRLMAGADVDRHGHDVGARLVARARSGDETGNRAG